MSTTLWPGVRTADRPDRDQYPADKLATCAECGQEFYKANVAEICWACWYSGALRGIEERYAEVIAALEAIGGVKSVEATQTGGMCMALSIVPDDEGGHWLLTDAEDTLSYEWDPANGWALGWYDGEEGEWDEESELLTREAATVATAVEIMTEGITARRPA